MKIEDAIKQKKFNSAQHKAVINIIYTAAWLNNAHARFLKSYGLSPQQFNIMRILRGQHPNPASVNLLIDRMLDKMSNASRLVEKLRLKSLIERQVNPDDRRQVDVVITKEGLKLLEELDIKMRDMEKQNNALTEKEALLLSDLLDKIRTNK